MPDMNKTSLALLVSKPQNFCFNTARCCIVFCAKVGL